MFVIRSMECGSTLFITSGVVQLDELIGSLKVGVVIHHDFYTPPLPPQDNRCTLHCGSELKHPY